ncbi:E3 ubiquitin-protein ligase BOI-like [Salvia hispanica]|uniref:E3 ubiquitin-protein ligase BOI-like n=1 Tax=Salvia hispanica TaxID=49212 RepID=UPI002009CA8F|nr:E3 ubiquitin-protein ligase BOI-like [Salvia hispanica]
MAVEATHPNFFPPQFLQRRESFMNPPHEGYAYSHKFQAVNQHFVSESNSHIPATRKRYRDELFGENMLPQFRREIDSLIHQHTMKIRLELKQQAKMAAARMGESMAKTLREKDDEIEKMARLNQMLEEKAKGLYLESQLWQEMARANEAAANSLRHALAQFGGAATAAVEEDVESCGSCCDETTERRMCRICGERQCCVVVLPCRHLCFCSGCGSGLHQACPVCNASMTATLHVNMS